VFRGRRPSGPYARIRAVSSGPDGGAVGRADAGFVKAYLSIGVQMGLPVGAQKGPLVSCG
jgi:hypothetical protein